MVGGSSDISRSYKAKKVVPVLKQLALGKLADTLVWNMRDYTPPEKTKDLRKTPAEKNEPFLSLRHKIKPPLSGKEKKIVVTTFLNANNYKASSKLGRLIAEGLIAELHNRNFTVIEYHTRNNVMLKEAGGDFALSRDIEHIRKSYQANYLITGTYSDTGKTLFIAGRLIDMKTSVVVSAGNYEVVKTPAIALLIEDDPATQAEHQSPVPSAYER